jgi:hypothetical protein
MYGERAAFASQIVLHIPQISVEQDTKWHVGKDVSQLLMVYRITAAAVLK